MSPVTVRHPRSPRAVVLCLAVLLIVLLVSIFLSFAIEPAVILVLAGDLEGDVHLGYLADAGRQAGPHRINVLVHHRHQIERRLVAGRFFCRAGAGVRGGSRRRCCWAC